MSTQVYEQTLDLVTSLVETVPFTLNDPSQQKYPSLNLRRTGKEETVSFDLLTLENPMVQVLAAPQLGGRILSIRDKRTGLDLWPRPTSLTLVEGGSRGVDLPLGLEWWVGQELRHNALGPIEVRVQDPPDDDSPGGFLAFELLPGKPLSFHSSLALLPDRAEIVLEMKLYNRSLVPQECPCGLRISCGEGDLQWFGQHLVFYSSANDAGFLVRDAKASWGAITYSSGLVHLAHSSLRNPLLNGRQTVSWRTSLIPLSGLGSIDAASPEAALSLRDGILKVQVPARALDHKFFLLTSDSQTLESEAHLYPEQTLVMDLTSLPSQPLKLVLRNPGKEAVLTLEKDRTVSSVVARPQDQLANFTELSQVISEPHSESQEGRFLSLLRESSTHESDWQPYLSHPLFRGLAYLAQARDFRSNGQKDAADLSLERALTYDGEDALGWIDKAILAVELGRGSDIPEILNAHYLAPLEPMLRVQSFLAQGQTGEREPNPILRPLASSPDLGQECVCHLIRGGLLQDAVRLLDELIRHRRMPLLLYLLAWCYLQLPRMETTAAEHVAAASSLALEPPFPWRDEERFALRELVSHFPENGKLKEWNSLLEAFPG
ncbi:MAG: DUF5107 domain-containing protein [Fimbriimonadaceae bacterium]|jgi:hypothetical protein|nr:DUF5107 domain-containing protein [Fimbriimonadaceae bacterium]